MNKSTGALTIYNARFVMTAKPAPYQPPSTDEVRELYHDTLTEMRLTIGRAQ